MGVELIFKYFTTLTDAQKAHFEALEGLYQDWNKKINVVSRKDIDELYLRHVLHSLGITKIQEFNPGANLLDVGTGGGFPGIPLAILFPEVQFTLVDAIGKKIRVVQEVVDGLQLQNVKAIHTRVEDLDQQFDFIVSRAVAAMPTFVRWTKGKIKKQSLHSRKNGILYLKGGDLTEELKGYSKVEVFDLNQFFSEAFFETKKVVYLPQKYGGTS
ncbi:16S rRNA (guanine(527)-N(7))-methyltransferase RsmG [Flagellimonas myxillae]|uniref:16S rRNA (guanine(527)-N(7))-methyltransferase RsmG n=1 Tax=Flagellimonas myxillae TaxID=2942214 RepID=UPI00201ECED4|nr:16S rRNA (guanine(527)-N(7))-methyltransferase RsmG [Muricauda myxillae]MCL6268275.1 16S rRNA (guanine(527)-N(7))-methyltransferase RsmG [Muricauda myxillae]